MSYNEEQVWLSEARSLGYFFYRQGWHFLSLLILVPLAWYFSSPGIREGVWLGWEDSTWFWIGVSLGIIHQVLVWLVFRLQLGWAFFSRVLGPWDLMVWGLIFLPLLAVRPILVFGLARATEGTLFFSRQTGMIGGLIFLIPAVYTFWSVVKYFGITRALGGDHFRIEYRKQGLVKKGIFKFSSNGMYSFGFFLLWSIALFHASQEALILAIFQHAYVWVHHFCTEKPDMELIYGNKNLS